jgi:quinol monooxygenase YgiN
LIPSPALAPSRIGQGQDTTTIRADNEVVTLIDIFTVEPEHQQRLVDVLVTATETMVSKQAGFVSANIHKSLDGIRVANYAQFRSPEAFEAMLAKSEATVHMREAAKIGSFDAHLYEVVFIVHAS